MLVSFCDDAFNFLFAGGLIVHFDWSFVCYSTEFVKSKVKTSREAAVGRSRLGILVLKTHKI